MNRKASTLAVYLAVLAVAACGSNTTAPQNALVGSYTATQWVTTGGTPSGQTNQILAGSTLNITLANDGTTSGHLHLAASGANPTFDADMAGTWSESNNKVTISQTADTFVRNLTFNVVPNGSKWALSADQVVSGTRIQITLDQLLFGALTGNE